MSFLFRPCIIRLWCFGGFQAPTFITILFFFYFVHQQYIATHYIGPRLVITAAGAVDHQEVVEHARRLFAQVPEKGMGRTHTPNTWHS